MKLIRFIMRLPIANTIIALSATIGLLAMIFGSLTIAGIAISMYLATVIVQLIRKV